jgi:hypothetical protein
VPYEDDIEDPRVLPDIEDVTNNNSDVNQQPMHDRLIHADVTLQRNNQLIRGKVKGRSLAPDGSIIGYYNDNPVLNTLTYDVEFPDGEVREYTANIIAENMLTRVDSDGHVTMALDCILDFEKDDTAYGTKDKYVYEKNGRRRLRKSTQGWKLKVLWKDGTTNFIPLKDIKESNPIEVAEFAKARNIHNEPAFCWWVPYVLRKREVIISKATARIRETTHKYGIQVPRSIKEAESLDRANGNTFWRDAIDREMKELGVAVDILESGEIAPKGYQQTSGHIIFDIKMDFTRKARWVLNGHKNKAPEGSTYAGVVSRESVRIAFTYAALNGLDVWSCDIKNAYLQAPTSEKCYVVCGPEWGLENQGKIAIIVRAIYGGKAAGRDFRNHLRDCMEHLGFEACLADPDAWMRPAIRANGQEYFEYVLLYTDDALVVSENPETIIRRQIGKYFHVKPNSIGPPSLYLGGGVRKVLLNNMAEAWAFSSSQYVQAATKNVEDYLRSIGKNFPKKCDIPLPVDYRPELDTSTELEAKDAGHYQSLIGILRWIVELGRIDICLEVSMMASCVALPRDGQLEMLYRIFAHLKKYHNTEMVFDPSVPDINKNDFEKRDWSCSEFSSIIKSKREVHPRAPVPRGMGFTIIGKVDADHAADTITRRSRTGFIVYLNSAPIYWFSKKQTSVETSSFGSEFIAMKQLCEYLYGLRYKLQMMGIPCEGPAYIYGDNQSVLANTTVPESTLKKKSSSLAYHLIREGVALDEWRTTYVNTNDNEADLLTKVLPFGEKRRGFVRKVLHHIYGNA